MSHFRNGFLWIVGSAQGFNFLCGIWIGLDGDDVKSFQFKSSSVRVYLGENPFQSPTEKATVPPRATWRLERGGALRRRLFLSILKLNSRQKPVKGDVAKIGDADKKVHVARDTPGLVSADIVLPSGSDLLREVCLI